jgi:PilZ domain
MSSFGKSNGGGRRKSARSQEPLLVTLSTLAADYRAGVVNVSSTGAQVSAPCLPAPGEDVIFKADKVHSMARVVWSEPGQCGVAFERPITDEDAERLRNEADVWREAGWSHEREHSEATAKDQSGPELLPP